MVRDGFIRFLCLDRTYLLSETAQSVWLHRRLGIQGSGTTAAPLLLLSIQLTHFPSGNRPSHYGAGFRFLERPVTWLGYDDYNSSFIFSSSSLFSLTTTSKRLSKISTSPDSFPNPTNSNPTHHHPSTIFLYPCHAIPNSYSNTLNTSLTEGPVVLPTFIIRNTSTAAPRAESFSAVTSSTSNSTCPFPPALSPAEPTTPESQGLRRGQPSLPRVLLRRWPS